jgi:HK97 gp10 family phage protein
MIEARAKLTQDVAARLLAAHLRALMRVTALLHAGLLERLNAPNTGVRRRRKKPRRGSYTVYPSPSKPGEPPRKRSGWLQRNVVYQIDKSALSARVGVTANARYGLYQELGTSRMAARPWLASTAREMAPRLAKLFAEEVARG